MTRSLVSLAILAAAIVPSALPGAQPTATNAEAIFEHAETTWSNMTYPSLVDYRVAVHLTAGGKRYVDRYSGEVETTTGECRVHTFSDAEAANPTTPHGINVILFFSLGMHSGSAPLGASNSANAPVLGINVNPAPKSITFGIPDLSPIYSFGIRAATHSTSNDDTSSPLKAIGRVVTFARRYDVQLVEQTTLDGTDVYHLALTPLRDPDRYRLRELWISTSTFDVIQARIHGNFADRPASTIPWLITFSTIDGATYIASEETEAPLPNRPVAFDAVTIDFENISARHGSRDLMFAITGTNDTNGQVHEPDSGSNCLAAGGIQKSQ